MRIEIALNLSAAAAVDSLPPSQIGRKEGSGEMGSEVEIVNKRADKAAAATLPLPYIHPVICFLKKFLSLPL